MYNKVVLDHFQNPRNLTEMKNPDAVGMGASQVCGDVMTLYLSIGEGHVKDANFRTMGCGAAIASGSAGVLDCVGRLRPPGAAAGAKFTHSVEPRIFE